MGFLLPAPRAMVTLLPLLPPKPKPSLAPAALVLGQASCSPVKWEKVLQWVFTCSQVTTYGNCGDRGDLTYFYLCTCLGGGGREGRARTKNTPRASSPFHTEPCSSDQICVLPFSLPFPSVLSQEAPSHFCKWPLVGHHPRQ